LVHKPRLPPSQKKFGTSSADDDGREGYVLCDLFGAVGRQRDRHDALRQGAGFGVAQNDAEAIRWFERAAAKGHAGAKERLAHPTTLFYVLREPLHRLK